MHSQYMFHFVAGFQSFVDPCPGIPDHIIQLQISITFLQYGLQIDGWVNEWIDTQIVGEKGKNIDSRPYNTTLDLNNFPTIWIVNRQMANYMDRQWDRKVKKIDSRPYNPTLDFNNYPTIVKGSKYIDGQIYRQVQKQIDRWINRQKAS